MGHTYWARPGLNDTSVDFFEDRELRARAPVYKKRRFKVVGVEANTDSAAPEIIYKVRFDDRTEAYIGLESFDKSLYRELEPNQVMTAPADSPIGAAPHLYIFERCSIFASDPDVIWARIKNDGPRTFKPFKRPGEQRRKNATVPQKSG